MNKSEKPGIEFTSNMLKKIEDYKTENLLTRNDFYKLSKITGKTTIDYRKKTKKISYGSLKKLKSIGIDLVQKK